MSQTWVVPSHIQTRLKSQYMKSGTAIPGTSWLAKCQISEFRAHMRYPKTHNINLMSPCACTCKHADIHTPHTHIHT